MPTNEDRARFELQKNREIDHLLEMLEGLFHRLAEHPEQHGLLQEQIDNLQHTLHRVEKRQFPG
jgi:uncharacterized membrane protein